jgi:cysteine desulfurase
MIAAIRDDTVLVTLMLANNESGALQPVKEVAVACRERGILMHTDAAQALGKVSCRLEDIGHPDMVSLVGHKIGAPKGIAALYVRPNCYKEHGRSLTHNHGILLLGGNQEFGRRGGTENVAFIVGMAKAAELATANLTKNAKHMDAMRYKLLKKLESNLLEAGIKVRPNGPTNPSLRLPNTLSVGLENVHSGDLLAEIGDRVAASAGATCHSAAGVSSVLKAMNVPDTFARGTLRLSVGPRTTPEEIDQAAKLIAEAAIEQTQTDII